jgi:hypothetical protein
VNAFLVPAKNLAQTAAYAIAHNRVPDPARGDKTGAKATPIAFQATDGKELSPNE